MDESAEIRFENEGIEGIVAIGTYLADAARRFGVHFEGRCEPDLNTHFCRLDVGVGVGILSAKTEEEIAYLEDRAGPNERLACQARIEKAGELSIMTKPRSKEPTEEKAPDKEAAAGEYRKAFSDLPLDKKISDLVQLEAIALSDALSYLVNSPFTVGDKILGIMSEFGFRKEAAEKERSRPAKHQEDSEKDRSDETEAKAK